MSHDIEAAWAATELARMMTANPASFIGTWSGGTGFQVNAASGGKHWPKEDGRLTLSYTASVAQALAVEYKRVNEGLHGVLTALGQSHSYLEKGFDGALMVIPERYSSHANPGQYLDRVLNLTSSSLPIGIITYQSPDPSKASPFQGRINVIRMLPMIGHLASPGGTRVATGRVETQWAHVREGSVYPDHFFRYLQTARKVSADSSSGSVAPPAVNIPTGLLNAVASINPAADPIEYLSNASGTTLHDEIWKHYWFNFILFDDNMEIWRSGGSPGNLSVNRVSALVRTHTGACNEFFSSRSDSIKQRVVRDVNNGTINMSEAWESFAKKVHDRAHSYREDLDSSLEALGMLGDDGRPTDLGNAFVDHAERNGGDANSGLARDLFDAALLQVGNFSAFLHYVHRLSSDAFAANELQFCAPSTPPTGLRLNFDSRRYLDYLEHEMEHDLRVLRKVSVRGGRRRQPFQAELALLRQAGFVSGFRPGVGLEINWPKVQEIQSVALPVDS